MGKIRKKTSKRGTSNRRAQIKQKVRETHKKTKRDAKRNPQWKSKHKKDPGIPNNFPYKEQILAEIAEERRKAEEAKERKKEEKKTLRAQAKAGVPLGAEPASDAEEGAGEEEEEEVTVGDAENAFLGISLVPSSAARTSAKGKAKAAPVEEVEEVEDVPLLLNPDWPHLGAVLNDADVYVQVLDAREPLAFRSAQIERLAQEKGKKMLFVLNKIDTCPREYVARWAAHLQTNHPTVLFRSATAFLPPVLGAPAQKAKPTTPATDAWGTDAVRKQLEQWATEHGEKPLKVAVVGLTNSGKSSFINSLMGRSVLPTYSPTSTPAGPSMTPYAVSLSLTLDAHTIQLIDTPGLTFSSSVAIAQRTPLTESRRSADVLIRARGRLDKLHDPQHALVHIIERLVAPEDLMLFYSLPAFDKSNNEAFTASLARSLGFIKRRGALDHAGAARSLLRDWATGKLPRVAVPPKGAVSGADAEDQEVLKLLKSTAEMKKGDGLVRLAAVEVEDREVDLEAPWVVQDDSDDDDEEEMDGNGSDDEEMEEEESDEDMEDDSEDVEETLPPPRSSKRKAGPIAPRPSKKVAFELPSSRRAKAAPAPPTKSAPVKKASNVKSALKTEVKPAKKAANAPKTKAATAPASEGGAYDFGAFFK
ncbi:hypothetical protein PENSPDRAFT_630282 [Peniophora sp. CONT]|nr:hypothetical protein PENSPDRAFT_630282 [Peniophora sp. CONT]